MRILCTNENRNFTDKISTHLMADGIKVDYYNTIKDCTNRIACGSYCLVLMNITCCQDWIVNITNIRQQSDIPIVSIEEKHNTANAVAAFRMGIDDYIIESMNSLEAALRIEAIAQRYIAYPTRGNNKSDENIIFGELKIDGCKHIAWKAEEELDLTKTEFELLYFFAHHSGQTLTREQLCAYLWDNEYVNDDKSIISHIHRLRMKIEDDPANPRYILTVRGVGYRFNIR